MDSGEAEFRVEPRPFLRWAGGKNWLVHRLADLFGPIQYGRYHEPFLGGGSFFFAAASGREAFLSDENEALIDTYRSLQADHQRVAAFMRTLKNTEEEYYRVRSLKLTCPFERAGRFIYLNQTSFNGIYRVNLKGVYNVPYGRRSKLFLEPEVLAAAARALRSAHFRSGDFEGALADIRAGDLVFVDPPYTVSHNQNGFIKYNQALFSLADQYRLADFIREIKNKGALYILTNAAHEKIAEIFDLGDARLEVSRANLIGGKKAQRGHVSEYVFTNVAVRPV